MRFMDARQFFERVKIMRHFQKEYFKTRSRTALRQSKALEREIDAEIDRVKEYAKGYMEALEWLFGIRFLTNQQNDNE